MRNKIIIFGIIIIALAAVGYKLTQSKPMASILPVEEAKAKVEKFINNNLMQPGSKATIKEVTEEGDLYKVVVSIGAGQDIDSYLTKDGRMFFPQAMNITEIESQNNTQADASANTQPTAVVKTKQDKPVVELFVMSYCPYGTQIEKGILPVLETLGDKISFELKFVDYAMHDKKEIDENLRQYCLVKKGNDKLAVYLNSFLADGDSAKAFVASGISAGDIQSCIDSADKEYKITEGYNDKSAWKGNYPPFNVDKADNEKYGVSGSPTLVINGETVSSARDAKSLLAAICSGFNTQPEQCGAQLSSATPAPGFGSGTGTADDGSCD
ncbi:hypothetical protein COV49_03210 [Candidatus Falkowbacteria bacterium CG11_big_fil_rev_8_21_14_0_20_39_10]|uniref:Thioredoxin-like fold domain-containing protein n=1 Tax=Candidatus Falkowbacteria bacterium CG11_big_fil_rev_8_21_14_0_20_39_10 TaxID=1974570 RepID=A0A2M6K8Q6_9BACT|nr:MAG: hypothetical protein COV49_03210 [Candidatus Falkowbacteria bacterium CG11_big_fil_rev_8_21_14_0_20_39_10]